MRARVFVPGPGPRPVLVCLSCFCLNLCVCVMYVWVCFTSHYDCAAIHKFRMMSSNTLSQKQTHVHTHIVHCSLSKTTLSLTHNLSPPQDFHVHSLNVHRILLSSVMVAAKFLDDFYYSNEFWAKIGGVPNSELNTLELEFLFMTNFDLHVCLPPCPPLQSHTLLYMPYTSILRTRHNSCEGEGL